MIHELKQPGSSVLATNCPFPEARAIVEGSNPGWLAVDNLNAPRAAWVWAQGISGLYLIGDPSNAAFLEELGLYTDKVLRPRLHDLGVAWFEIGCYRMACQLVTGGDSAFGVGLDR